MRLLGTMPTDTDATRFGDYLLSIGMPNHVEAGRDGSWQVWIEHDDHLEQATSQLHLYVATPNDPKYSAASSAAMRLRKEAASAAARRQKNFTDVRTSWAAIPRQAAVVTWTVIVLCIGVFVLQQSRFSMDVERWLLFYTPIWLKVHTPTFAETFQAFMGQDPEPARFTLHDAFALILRGQVWRLFTPTLMHANIGHILFNLWAFAQVGAMIESRKGWRLMLALVLLGAGLSCSGQAAWDALRADGGMGFVGLSGVVYTTFGYAWIRGKLAPIERVGLNQQTVGLMLGWLVLCMTGLLGPIANAAHLIGLLVGVAIGYAPRLRRRMKLG